MQCDSYEDVAPIVLIGSPHASVIENAGKLLEGGEGKPVGIFTKLGWSIYGGYNDQSDSPCRIGVTQSFYA